MTGRVEVGETLREALAAWRHRFTALVWAGILVGLVPTAAEGLAIAADSAAATAVPLLLELIGYALLGGLAAHLLGPRADAGSDLSGALRATALQAGPLMVAGVALFLGMAVGFLLLIVPGLYLFAAWAVVFPVLALEGVGAMDAFGRSRELARGNMWRVLAVLVTATLGSIVISAALLGATEAVADDAIATLAWGLLNWAVVAPLLAVVGVILYRRLVALGREEEAPEAEPEVELGAGSS